jgi:hypothetical protein
MLQNRPMLMHDASDYSLDEILTFSRSLLSLSIFLLVFLNISFEIDGPACCP